MLGKVRKFQVEHVCSSCPHNYSGNIVRSHFYPTTGLTLGEVVLKAEADPYLPNKESLISVREIKNES